MLSGLSTYALAAAQVYNQTNLDLGKTLLRLASGKKINYPSDDALVYLRADSLKAQQRGYERLQGELGEWSDAMTAASSAAATALDNINRMKDLLYLAEQKIGDPVTNEAELDSYQTQFVELAKSVGSLVKDTNWRGIALLNNAGTIASIYLAPGATSSVLTLAPGRAIDTAAAIDPLVDRPDLYGLNVDAGTIDSAEALVNSALSQVKSFIGTVSGYADSLQSHRTVGESIIQNLAGAQSSMLDINDAQEMMTFTSENIRKQASLAMLAQANVSNQGILLLYGIKQ